jgi:hypothetical protein
MHTQIPPAPQLTPRRLVFFTTPPPNPEIAPNRRNQAAPRRTPANPLPIAFSQLNFPNYWFPTICENPNPPPIFDLRSAIFDQSSVLPSSFSLLTFAFAQPPSPKQLNPSRAHPGPFSAITRARCYLQAGPASTAGLPEKEPDMGPGARHPNPAPRPAPPGWFLSNPLKTLTPGVDQVRPGPHGIILGRSGPGPRPVSHRVGRGSRAAGRPVSKES